MPVPPDYEVRDYPPIADYAVIGDCRTAALVSKAGSLDWLCLPRFDSPAVFAAILDARKGGRFSIRPAGSFRVSRRYLPGTNLLETTFTTATGVLRLTDLFFVEDMAERRRELRTEHEIIRRLECLEGTVEVEVVCDPRPGFGAWPTRPRDRRHLGWSFEAGPQVIYLQSQIPLISRSENGHGPQDGLAGKVTMTAGERRYLSLAIESGDPAAIPPFGEAGELAEARLDRSRRWWETWAGRCRYQGAHRDAVCRSILALKLLTYAPSGAVVAAPTTSLPEQIGGVRNWDYRYCWLRDASWTLAAFFDLGYQEEGKAFLSWILYATRLHHRQLSVLYDVHGVRKAAEREVAGLSGYAGSRPVRVGNGAVGQLQLDIYGELVESAFDFVRRGGELDRSQAKLLARLGDIVCRLWRLPDEGIWEKRSGRFDHTYSKMMCWVALDRLLQLAEAGHVLIGRVDAGRLGREREAIRAAIELHGWNEALESYVDVFDGDGIDASLLLLGVYGYCDRRSPRLASTCARLDRELQRNGLVYRYPPGTDGIPGGESAFGLCSFWAVEVLARRGELQAAKERLDHLLTFGNDVGLYAEEIDPQSGAFLGNFPQAFSHVGLVNAALALAEAEGAARPAATSGKTGTRV